MIPQILWLVLSAIGTTLMLQNDKSWSDVFGTFVSFSVQAGLLYWGGFFDVLLR